MVLGGYEPSADQSYPDPSKFTRTRDGASTKSWTYAYDSRTVGFNLRHEIKHDTLIAGPSRRVDLKQFTRPNGTIDQGRYDEAIKPNRSENDADEGAMTDTRAAWKKLVDSDFKDSSGEVFGFSLPDKSGYILT